MDKKLYNQLMNDIHSIVPGEYARKGWHFCAEWDGLLVGPGMPEMDCCRCFADRAEYAGPAVVEDMTIDLLDVYIPNDF